jgi:O-antigen/teichoic acid export membrane protein
VEETSQLNQHNASTTRLRDRALAVGAWTVCSYAGNIFVRIFSNLILTRLLFPEAFGSIAAAMALIYGLALVSDFGVHSIIVQSPRGEQPDFLHSAWVFQLLRAIIVWVVLATICAFIYMPAIHNLVPVASVFADRKLPLVTAIMGLALVLGGAESTCISLNARRLNYKPIVWLDLISKLLSLPIMVIWAWIAPSVWALVGGILASNVFRLALSHVMVPGPQMRFDWQRDHFGEIVRFGRWIAASSFASFISQQSDVILLGFLTPSATLGLYSIAKLLVGTGEGLLEQLNSALALPIFGEVIRKDPSMLRSRYYRFRVPIDLAAGLLSGGLFAAGAFIVNFLYDTRYSQAGPMLEILALGTASLPLSIIASAFIATGDTYISAIASILKAVSLIASIAIGFSLFGLSGAIGGIAVHRLIPSMVVVLLAHRREWIGIWHELRIIPAFFLGVLIGNGFVLSAAALNIRSIHQIVHLSSSQTVQSVSQSHSGIEASWRRPGSCCESILARRDPPTLIESIEHRSAKLRARRGHALN